MVSRTIFIKTNNFRRIRRALLAYVRCGGLALKGLIVVCKTVTHGTVLGPRWSYIMSTIVNLQLMETKVTVSMLLVWICSLLQSCSRGHCSSWVCHCITGQLMLDASRQCEGFIFKGPAAHTSSLAALPLKIKVMCSFETSETNDSITQLHIPKYLNLHG